MRKARKKQHAPYSEKEKKEVLKAMAISSNIAASLKDKRISSSLYYKWKREAERAGGKIHA